MAVTEGQVLESKHYAGRLLEEWSTWRCFPLSLWCMLNWPREVVKGQAEGSGPHDDLAEVIFAQGILQTQP